MELIVISESQIKLMLTRTDLASYSGSTGEVVREIIRDAHRIYGIRRLDGRVYVQCYPSKEGGCELFVTQLSSAERALTKASEERLVTEIHAHPGKKSVYSFPSMNALLGCCAALLRLSYDGASAAYVDRFRNTYYLTLDHETHAAGEHLGSLCPAETIYYINEHCDVIRAPDAAEKLGVLA